LLQQRSVLDIEYDGQEPSVNEQTVGSRPSSGRPVSKGSAGASSTGGMLSQRAGAGSSNARGQQAQTGQRGADLSPEQALVEQISPDRYQVLT